MLLIATVFGGFAEHAQMIDNEACARTPHSCPAERAKPCKSTKFTVVEGTRVCRDYQEIKIQEQLSLLNVGSIPRSMMVVLEDDLVDRCKPGDDIVVVGSLRAPVIDSRVREQGPGKGRARGRVAWVRRRRGVQNT